MEEEKQFSEKESLELIKRMIYEGKNYFHESGIASLIGGFGVVIYSLLAYFIARGLSFPFNPFYLLIITFTFQIYFSLKEEKKKEAKTFTDEAIDYVWLGFFISVIIIVIAGSLAHIGYMMISVCLFLNALAAFFTGMITKFPYLIFASIVSWLLAAASFFLLNENSFLLLALAAILVWIIPGFMLNAYLKKLQHAR